MARLSTWLWLIAGLFLTFEAGPVFAAQIDLDAVFKDVDNASLRLRQRDTGVGASLDRDIAILSDALNDRSISPQATLLLRYYRAIARVYRNEFNAATGHGYDSGLAHNALSELDDVVATLDKKFAGTGGDLKGNALYFAGSLSFSQLNDEAQAYRYWTACAGEDHAGCLDIIALASTTGKGGRPVDLVEAMRIYKRVFQTTTQYGCAGVHAAYSIATLVALGAVRDAKENPEIWIENATNLLNAVEADQPNDDRCSRVSIQLSHYLILLSRGKKKPEILDAILARASSNPGSTVAAYLKGTLDSDTLQERVAQYPESAKCNVYFYALWAADIAHDAARARHYQSLLSASQEIACRVDVAYTRSLKALQ